MIAAGILTIGDKVELLEGQIIEMAPQNPPHASITASFSNDLPILAGKAWVRSQLPVTIPPDSEPDIAIVDSTSGVTLIDTHTQKIFTY